MIVARTPGAGPSGGTLTIDVIAATAGQTAFTTSLPPTSDVGFEVNGVLYQEPADYTVAGSAVTWLNTDFALQVGDKVQLVYQA